MAEGLAVFHKHNSIEIKYIRPRKPIQNSLVERFNSDYHQKELNAYLFDSLSQVRILFEQWMGHHNRGRPHEALQNLIPKEFLT